MKQKELAAFAWKFEYTLVLKEVGIHCSRHQASGWISPELCIVWRVLQRLRPIFCYMA